MPTPGPVNGAKVKLESGDVYWSFAVDDNLDPAFKLMHQEEGSNDKILIAKGTKPSAVRVDFGVNGLEGDKLHWRILCLPFNAGTFPVYVQLFQGSDGNYDPISDVIQYDVTVGPGGKIVTDFIEFE